MHLDEIRTRLLAVNTDAADARNLLIEIFFDVEGVKQKLADIRKLLDDSLMTFIAQHGDIQLDKDRRLYIGTVKQTKAINDTDVIEKLLELGSLELLKSGKDGVLSSDPFKHGAVRNELQRVLGMAKGSEEYERLFRTTEVPELKEGKPTGEPKRRVQTADARFGA